MAVELSQGPKQPFQAMMCLLGVGPGRFQQLDCLFRAVDLVFQCVGSRQDIIPLSILKDRSAIRCLGVVVLVALGLLYRRYRRSNPEERRQIRWVAFGSAAALGIGMVPFIVAPVIDPDSLFHGQLLLSIGAFALLLIPVKGLSLPLF